MKKKILMVSALFATVLLMGCIGQEKSTEETQEIKVLRMSLIPADDAEEMLRNYQPMADYLEEKLGIPVEIKVTSDYTASIEAMRAKHIDMAWFGPFSYVLAAKEANAEAIVNGVRRDTGKSTYKTVFITRPDTGIKNLQDLKGRSFAFVDPASTSGNLIPRKVLTENNIDPEKDFSLMYYAGTHNAVELAVANRKVDAGADSDTSYYRMVKAGEIDPDTNIIIHESEPIPGSPIAVRGDLPENLKKKIQKALIDMDEQTMHKVGGWGDIARYQEVKDSDYDIIRETAKILDLDLSKKK